MKTGVISVLVLIIAMVFATGNERPAVAVNALTQKLGHAQWKTNYQKAQMIPGIRNAFKF